MLVALKLRPATLEGSVITGPHVQDREQIPRAHAVARLLTHHPAINPARQVGVAGLHQTPRQQDRGPKVRASHQHVENIAFRRGHRLLPGPDAVPGLIMCKMRQRQTHIGRAGQPADLFLIREDNQRIGTSGIDPKRRLDAEDLLQRPAIL